MDELTALLRLFETFKEALHKAAPSKQLEAIKKATTGLKACINLVAPTPKKPTQKELKERLLADRKALKIRALWTAHKTCVDLRGMADEVGLMHKKPSIDHIVMAYYYPSNRLDELLDRFEGIAANDPAAKEIKRLQDLRGALRALHTLEEIENALLVLVQEEGLGAMRRFAVHLDTKDSSGKRRLAKTASQGALVKAVAAHLWTEKKRSEAQEGKR
jgi:hypothetical protein